MPQGEHSAILSTFIKLPLFIKIFLSNFEWPFYTGFTVQQFADFLRQLDANISPVLNVKHFLN